MKVVPLTRHWQTLIDRGFVILLAKREQPLKGSTDG